MIAFTGNVETVEDCTTIFVLYKFNFFGIILKLHKSNIVELNGADSCVMFVNGHCQLGLVIF